jgi:proteasome lid subunit RPN8/RPN11
MEEIRVAAAEAFFSLPHGGAEIGGIFFGTHAGDLVRILAARPLACDYALGPTFKLSGSDHARLADLLEHGCDDLRAQGWEPVGWYHSHTRSEILLSAGDLEIYDHYFPDPWHVALVVRPHAMRPMRAGFFFREAGGSIHADSSYSEFVVQPDTRSAVEHAVSPPIAAGPVPAETVPFVAPPPKRSRWWFWWPVILLAIAAGLLLCKGDRTRVFAADRTPSGGLMAGDVNGQLLIHWDGGAEPIRSAESGTLEIADGAMRTVVVLDRQQLRGGTVGYTRIGAHVEMRMTLRQPGGKVREEFADFIGRAVESDSDASLSKLRRDLQDQVARMDELEHTVAGLQRVIRQDQERRLPAASH